MIAGSQRNNEHFIIPIQAIHIRPAKLTILAIACGVFAGAFYLWHLMIKRSQLRADQIVLRSFVKQWEMAGKPSGIAALEFMRSQRADCVLTNVSLHFDHSAVPLQHSLIVLWVQGHCF